MLAAAVGIAVAGVTVRGVAMHRRKKKEEQKKSEDSKKNEEIPEGTFHGVDWSKAYN